jgi:succinoglycan biosynthesis transport protein ExoP
MSSGLKSDNVADDTNSGGIAVGDVLFTLFRHRMLILGSVLAGLVAVAVVRFVKPPDYESTAQIYIPYVIDLKAVNPSDPTSPITSTGLGGDVVMNTEVEMLRSFDTALDVVDVIGAEKILARYGGGSNRLGAAGVVASGMKVSPPRTMTLTVTFSHRDSELVQPVMEEIVKAYMRRHSKIHIKASEEVLEQRLGDAQASLAATEEEIKALKNDSGVPNLRERIELISKEYSDLQSKLLKDLIELAGKKAMLGEFGMVTNASSTPIPADKIQDYSDVITIIEDLKRQYRSMVLGDYNTNHPLVVRLEVKLQAQQSRRTVLEQEYPALKNYISVPVRDPGPGGTNSARFDLESEWAKVSILERSVKSDQAVLEKLKDEAFRLMELEPRLTQLERQRDQAKKDYEFILDSRQKASVDSASPGAVVNMRVTQSPTPPRLNQKKLLKLLGIAFGGCVGMGVGLAFLFDLVLDRSIRRPTQLARGLKLPVLLTIPDATREAAGFLSMWTRNQNRKLVRSQSTPSPNGPTGAVAAWRPDNQLQLHIEGLRERVITHFEARNLEHHPKLVALTACAERAGVSTLASGLAAMLSRTGSGSVLLVDLNGSPGATHSFYHGKPGCGPSESMDTDVSSEARNGSSHDPNLAVAKMPAHQSRSDRLAEMLPPDFNELRPKLRAEAYDYVVFDMRSISPASVTPRLSGHMDLVLLVIESEKTKDYAARRALELLRESRANVAAVLNKYHNPVPAWLAHD